MHASIIAQHSWGQFCLHVLTCWYNNHMTVSLFHSLYQDGSGRQCLLIERVMKSDAGWYTLSAINEAGMSTCNARLDVGSKSSSFLGCLLYEIVAGSYHSSPACNNQTADGECCASSSAAREHVKQMPCYAIERKLDECRGRRAVRLYWALYNQRGTRTSTMRGDTLEGHTRQLLGFCSIA